MNDSDLFVVGDRVTLNGMPANWIDGNLEPFDSDDAHTQGMRGTVLRVGSAGMNVVVSWDATGMSEWIAASSLGHFRYSSGDRDRVPEPYSHAALRMLPGSHLIDDVIALLENTAGRAELTDARARLREALNQRALFTVALPRRKDLDEWP